ncbi:MAG: glycosyltransferase family 9 protein [Bdellovibrionales bacterium]|nr:glycosyltransferase family 9 protein [Bdellovibrionales bacterium]
MTREGAPSSFLIVLSGALGDISRGFCILPPLRLLFPQAKLSWLAEEKWAPLVRAHPLVDEVYTYTKNRGVFVFLDVWRTLQGHSFDVTLDLQRHTKSGVFSLLSHAPTRVGFSRKNAKELNYWFNTDHIVDVSDSDSKVLHYLEFVRFFGYDEKQVDFGISRDAVESFVPTQFPRSSKKTVSIVLGSSWPSKDWTAEGYAILVKRLVQEEYSVLLVGDQGQVSLAESLQESTDFGGNLTNFVGKTSLNELVAVLANSHIAVGPDSGPGHLCSLFRVPYVALFGPTDPKRVAPFGSEHLVLQSELPCVPCKRRVCPGLNRICMRLLSPESVIEKVHAELNSRV